MDEEGRKKSLPRIGSVALSGIETNKLMRKARNKSNSPALLPSFPRAGTWEGAWQKYGSKAGMPGYELPVEGLGSEDRQFLTSVRTPQKERARLKRINAEFDRAFKTFYDVGPG